LKYKIRTASALNDRKHQRTWMSEIGRRATPENRSAGRKKLGRRKLKKIAQLAARTRWHGPQVSAVQGPNASAR